MTEILTDAEELLARLEKLDTRTRRLIAIAGAPGSGKSTLVDHLSNRLCNKAPGSAAVIPMDGYHLDDNVLSTRGALARKGAPHTFDVGGFTAMLKRLKENNEDEIAVPVFDRKLEISRAGGRMISKDIPLLLVEGNYLLLDKPGWSDLRPLFDLTISLDVPFEELERRLLKRWLDHGFDEDRARTKALENDMPNARLVIESSFTADLLYRMKL
ncbi:nucleoside triphosphate hydrolase [uncultured Cohaesibacter sp.]|uniref:nucleoside triphosphate hydrolase n=1 Tax=uncultured Cohaesibacter sp. TaxID=1002546 RepID=UPI0029C96697|nr:nucleoside triphosphate hydrolase [uncultured Cohaesibacter sp.]